MPDFASMPWNELYQLRMQTKDPLQQALIAPFEHRAYAREQVAENPMSAPFYATAIPAYQAVKGLGSAVGAWPQDATSTPPSWNQVSQGLTGVGEGLADWWKNR